MTELVEPARPGAGRPARDTLTPAEHLEGLRAALVSLVRSADRAGLDAPLPACPDRDVRDLLAHLGAGHREAAATLRGRPLPPGAADGLEVVGRCHADPVEWLRDGAVELARALAAPAGSWTPPAPEVDGPLADAPGPRAAWARRQCHATVLASVDALAAALGRRPRAEEVDVGPPVALDGIDELLTGFLPRPRSRVRSDPPVAVLVLPSDADRSWLVRVGRAPALVTRRPGTGPAPAPGEPPADVVLRGSSVQLLLALWSRGEEVVPGSTCGEPLAGPPIPLGP